MKECLQCVKRITKCLIHKIWSSLNYSYFSVSFVIMDKAIAKKLEAKMTPMSPGAPWGQISCLVMGIVGAPQDPQWTP